MVVEPGTPDIDDILRTLYGFQSASAQPLSTLCCDHIAVIATYHGTVRDPKNACR